MLSSKRARWSTERVNTGPLFTFSSTLNKCFPMSLIFGRENRQRVFALPVCNLQDFVKQSTSLVFSMATMRHVVDEII